MIGVLAFQSRKFDDDVVSDLFCTNKDTENRDDFQISKLQKKDIFLARIATVNSVKSKEINARYTNGLPYEFF